MTLPTAMTHPDDPPVTESDWQQPVGHSGPAAASWVPSSLSPLWVQCGSAGSAGAPDWTRLVGVGRSRGGGDGPVGRMGTYGAWCWSAVADGCVVRSVVVR